MNGDLLILGAGMFGEVVKEIAEKTGSFGKISFLDDRYGAAPASGCVGKLGDYVSLAGEYGYAVVSIGDPKIRGEWTEKLLSAGYRVPALVSDAAYVSPSARVGKGSVVAPMAVINPHASVGDGTFVMAGSVVDHNAAVGNYCNIQCKTVVAPCALMPDFSKTLAGDIFRGEK